MLCSLRAGGRRGDSIQAGMLQKGVSAPCLGSGLPVLERSQVPTQGSCLLLRPTMSMHFAPGLSQGQSGWRAPWPGWNSWRTVSSEGTTRC